MSRPKPVRCCRYRSKDVTFTPLSQAWSGTGLSSVALSLAGGGVHNVADVPVNDVRNDVCTKNAYWDASTVCE